MEAGLAFDAALAQVARNTEGPLADEFFRVLQEMQIGMGRTDAMRALAERTEVAELKAFVTAMVQADAFGIPIANVLRIQAKEMRIKRRQRAEEQAQKVPVKILFPLIFCILPACSSSILGTGGHPDHRLVQRAANLMARVAASSHETRRCPWDWPPPTTTSRTCCPTAFCALGRETATTLDALVLDLDSPQYARAAVTTCAHTARSRPVSDRRRAPGPGWDGRRILRPAVAAVLPLPITRPALPSRSRPARRAVGAMRPRRRVGSASARRRPRRARRPRPWTLDALLGDDDPSLDR